MWVYDPVGNSGKTWLANFMSVLYSYELVDGVQTARDLCQLISNNVHGFCIDLSRASVETFDYNVLESLKNGFIMSGKYNGRILQFETVPVMVLSNYLPDYPKLSRDRWDVLTLGEGQFCHLDKSPKHCTKNLKSYVLPPMMPILEASFSLKEYLEVVSEEDEEDSNNIRRRRDTNPVPGQSNARDRSRSPILPVPAQTTQATQETQEPQPLRIGNPTKTCPLHSGVSRYHKGCPCVQKKSVSARQ